MKAETNKHKTNLIRGSGLLGTKAREIIASLNEAIEVERAGVPIESRFGMRKVEKLKKRRHRKKTNAAAEAKGREIIASLKEFVETVEAGIPLESRFTVRTIDSKK